MIDKNTITNFTEKVNRLLIEAAELNLPIPQDEHYLRCFIIDPEKFLSKELKGITEEKFFNSCEVLKAEMYTNDIPTQFITIEKNIAVFSFENYQASLRANY